MNDALVAITLEHCSLTRWVLAAVTVIERSPPVRYRGDFKEHFLGLWPHVSREFSKAVLHHPLCGVYKALHNDLGMGWDEKVDSLPFHDLYRLTF